MDESFDDIRMIKFKGRIDAYNDILDNLCQKELIPEARRYVIKQRDFYLEKIKLIEQSK